MASDEYLERIDRHMERMDRHMERGDQLMDEIRSEVQLTREVVRRNEIAFMENSRVNAELIDAVRDLGAEVRAQTHAIFRMLDRFDGGAEPAT